MINYNNPFLTSSLGSRNQFTQPQQNQYDFSGWNDRLNKIEKGIAGLTDQFSNFQMPGDVAPEYTGNAAPEPLEQTTNTPEPLGGIESLVAEPSPAAPAPMESPVTPMGGQAQTQSLTPLPSAGGMGALGQSRYMTYSPGHPDFKPLTAEQFAGQKDLWGRRKDYSDFASMASDVTGMGGGIGGLWRKQQGLGGDPRFGHAYEAWQDYAAGYGGSDPSQAMENWMQNYSFDLAPERPQFQPGPGGSLQSGLADYQQAQLDYENSPEYLEWKQRQEARGPLSASTTQAMGGGLSPMGGRPDINPFISMGMGGGQDPTYESYMDMVNQQAAGYRPQSTATSPNFASPGGIPGVMQQQTGLGGLAAYQGKQALQGPVQQQIKQSMGAGI